MADEHPDLEAVGGTIALLQIQLFSHRELENPHVYLAALVSLIELWQVEVWRFGITRDGRHSGSIAGASPVAGRANRH